MVDKSTDKSQSSESHLRTDEFEGSDDLNNREDNGSVDLNAENMISHGADEVVVKEDIEFITDKNAAFLLDAPSSSKLLLHSMLIVFIVLLIWASQAQLVEMTRGIGRVMPSTNLQVVQNYEGGIIERIFVSEGQHVIKGQALMQLDDTQYEASYKESSVEFLSELARVSRLSAELNGNAIDFPSELNAYPDYKNRELNIYEQRRKGLKNQIGIYEHQKEQAKQELLSEQARVKFLVKNIELTNSEIELTRPLAKQGAVSKSELIKLEQRVNDLQSEKSTLDLTIPRLQLAHQEAVMKEKEQVLKFKEEVVQELRESEIRLNQLTEFHKSIQDKVTRSIVRSPIKGIIKEIYISTIGGVVQPGEDILDIVPVGEGVFVEAQISPKDIGFVNEGMKAVVKFTAYDFTIYGGLDGVVDHISADTVKDEDKGEYYYLVKIKTNRSFLKAKGKKLSVIPGMKVNVDIVTGKKTLLEYMLKPILRAKESALRER